MIVTIPVQWYQLALGQVSSFSARGRFVTFAQDYHITLWAGGDSIGGVTIQTFEATPNEKLEVVVHRHLEEAARRVLHLFHGTLHAVIFNLGCIDMQQVRNELGEVVDLVNGEYTSMDLGLAYSQSEARANFRYMNMAGLALRLPHEITFEHRRRLSRYERPPVI